MAFYLNLFTVDTWERFQKHGASISGFSPRQGKSAQRLNPGDFLLCYLVHLSRWCGALEVASPSFEDDTPIYSDPDPYTVRFKVRPTVVLAPDFALPMFEDDLWSGLDDTKHLPKGARGWGVGYRTTLRSLSGSDGKLLLSALKKQAKEMKRFELTDRDRRNLKNHGKVETLKGPVAVEVPEAEDEIEEIALPPTSADKSDPMVAEARQSIQIQAQLAEIGAKMGFHIWIPAGDRVRVLELVHSDHKKMIINVLPLNYDENTLDTIRQIDVLWLKGRSMARAFEVEHTTAIYSGILRMADLMALQPNMQIRLHIVAPSERRDKVLREIKRPVFSLLENGPLYKKCTFLPYDAILEMAREKLLNHMSDSVLEVYEERAVEEV